MPILLKYTPNEEKELVLSGSVASGVFLNAVASKVHTSYPYQLNSRHSRNTHRIRYFCLFVIKNWGNWFSFGQ